MPVVLRIGPYKFFFFSLENDEPPHIHVQRDRDVAKFWLIEVNIALNTRYPEHELRYIRKLVEENREVLLNAWNAYFDAPDN